MEKSKERASIVMIIVFGFCTPFQTQLFRRIERARAILVCKVTIQQLALVYPTSCTTYVTANQPYDHLSGYAVGRSSETEKANEEVFF
jgi:membrane-bound metal-dependent hydrolase YbcI (DUF457 family)